MMKVLNVINAVIAKLNLAICNIKNIQIYVGTASDSRNDNTISGRLKALEESHGGGINLLDDDGKIKSEYLRTSRMGCGTWMSATEWSAEEWSANTSTRTKQIKEW